LRTVRSLIPVAPLAAVLAVVLAAAGPAAASAPPASRVAVSPTAASAQPPASKIAVPGRPAAASAARPEAATLSDQDLSGDFTGYGTNAGSYTSVGATWVEPAAQCTNDNSYITISVSINGFTGSSSTAEEDLGTIATCATGTPVYSDYYATQQGQHYNTYGDTVEPGDNFSASISYAGSGEYTYDLQDVTQGWTQDHTYDNPGAPTGNAEIGLTEAPGDFEAPVEFGAVGFGNATINGKGLSPGPGPTFAHSYAQDGDGTANLTSISTVKTSDGSFMMFYGAGQNVDANPMIGFEANYTGLWTSASDTGGYLGQMLAPGTSPSVAVLSDNGFEEAFQNANGELEVLGTDYNGNSQAGMMAGTSPSIAAGPNGTFEVAFEANTGVLWTFSPTGYGDQGYGMKAGTSPAITAVSGGYEIAFQANTGALWTVGAAGNTDTGLSMSAATSPAIATNSANVYEAAFQSSGGQLWTYTASAGGVNRSYTMMAGTDPALAALPDNSFEIAFQASTGHLWDYGPYYTRDTELGMMAGTSPSITADPSVGFEVAFQANTTALWTQNPSAGGVDWASGMHSGSSPSIAY